MTHETTYNEGRITVRSMFNAGDKLVTDTAVEEYKNITITGLDFNMSSRGPILYYTYDYVDRNGVLRSGRHSASTIEDLYKLAPAVHGYYNVFDNGVSSLRHLNREDADLHNVTDAKRVAVIMLLTDGTVEMEHTQ